MDWPSGLGSCSKIRRDLPIRHQIIEQPLEFVIIVIAFPSVDKATDDLHVPRFIMTVAVNPTQRA